MKPDPGLHLHHARRRHGRLCPSRAKGARGFTLIELMVVVAVSALLMSVAVPQYKGYVNRGHRAQARTQLVQIAQWMERSATATGTYPATADVPSSIKAVESQRYTITVTSTSTTYVIKATPINGQASDACGTFVLDQANQRSLSPNTTAALLAECWQR